MRRFIFFKGRETIRWRTHIGDVLCIHDMSTDHIINVVRCLQGTGEMRIPDPYQGKNTFEWLNIFHNELMRRRRRRND